MLQSRDPVGDLTGLPVANQGEPAQVLLLVYTYSAQS